jgi:hypothetical protein
VSECGRSLVDAAERRRDSTRRRTSAGRPHSHRAGSRRLRPDRSTAMRPVPKRRSVGRELVRVGSCAPSQHAQRAEELAVLRHHARVAERVFCFRSEYYGRRRGLSRHLLIRLRHRSRPAGPKPCVHRLLICSRRRRYSIGHRTGGRSVSRTCRCASCRRSEARRAARTGNGHLLGATTRCSRRLLPRNPATPSASGERPLLPPSCCRDGTRHPRQNCGDMPTVQREPAAPAAPR